MSQPIDEPIIPRLLASNALRANLDKHLTLSQMADQKAAMILTVSSLMITISVAQFERLGLAAFLMLIMTCGWAIVCSIVAITPVLHVKGVLNLFYFRSFAQVSEDEFIEEFKLAIADRDKLYDAYLREIYYLGKHRLTYKYRYIRNGLWGFLGGLLVTVLLTIVRHL